MIEVERESLVWRCRTDGCPWPDNEDLHRTPWCAAIQGHHCFGNATHQHRPRKGMGGHNPDAVIVALICAGMHDAVDNGRGIDNSKYYWDQVTGGTYNIYLRGKRFGDRVVMSRRIPA